MTNSETTGYGEKLSRYQNAIHACKLLQGLMTFSSQDGDNDLDDRYWTSIFHKMEPDRSRNKETRLGFGDYNREYSVVFAYDHQLKKSLFIKADFDEKDESSYLNTAVYAQCFESNHTLVAQFRGALMLYKLNPDTMRIDDTIAYKNADSAEAHRFLSNFSPERIVFEKTGSNYFAAIDEKGDVSLFKFDWEGKKILTCSLPGYMTTFGLLHCLFVHQAENRDLIAVLGIAGKQKSDPDMGYSLFVQKGMVEKDRLKLYNFKNEFFQQWTPSRFTFSKVSPQGYIKIGVYTKNGLLITETIVPTNFEVVKQASSNVTVSDLFS